MKKDTGKGRNKERKKEKEQDVLGKKPLGQISLYYLTAI
jgi:hypothetical protein